MVALGESILRNPNEVGDVAADFVEACQTNPLGVKGGGESGTVGSTAAVVNAIVDALAVYGVKDIDMPATPMKVWQAMHGGKAA